MRLLWRDLISLISSEKYFYRWPLWLVVRHTRQCCDQELWPLVFSFPFRNSTGDPCGWVCVIQMLRSWALTRQCIISVLWLLGKAILLVNPVVDLRHTNIVVRSSNFSLHHLRFMEFGMRRQNICVGKEK